MRRLLIGAVLASASALWPFSSSEKQDPPTPHPDAVPVAQQTALPRLSNYDAVDEAFAEELVLRSTFGGGAFPGEGLHCFVMAALVALKEVWPLALGGRLEFLPLMLTSVYGAVAVVALTAYSARRLLAAGRARNAGDWEASVVAPSPRRPRTKQPRSLLKTICSLLGSRDDD